MTSNHFDFETALRNRQATLASSLAEGRSALPHATASGDHSELDWSGALGRFLPNRYRVSKGQVADAAGTVSEAIDVIIHDAQYTPVLFQRHADDDASIVVPAESVYAVFEAKPEMNKGHLEYGAKKIESVRRLKRTSTAITHAGGKYAPKEPHRILGGFLADKCGWVPCLGEPFRQHIMGFSDNRTIDLGCALEGGAFERLDQNAGGQPLETSEPDLALMFFLIRLFRRLQEIGSVPAIDIEAYAPSIL